MYNVIEGKLEVSAGISEASDVVMGLTGWSLEGGRVTPWSAGRCQSPRGGPSADNTPWGEGKHGPPARSVPLEAGRGLGGGVVNGLSTHSLPGRACRPVFPPVRRRDRRRLSGRSHGDGRGVGFCPVTTHPLPVSKRLF